MSKPKLETKEQMENRLIIESIANTIGGLAKAVKSLLNGPLKKRALVILLASSSQIPQNKVESVLKALEELEKDWLNK